MEEVTKSNCGSSSSLCVTTTSIRTRRLEDFPADVLFNILSRLPEKSFMCCRDVCKIWRNIIDSPSFTYKHFTSTIAEHKPMLLHHTMDKHQNIRFHSLMDDGDDDEVLRSSKFPILEIANSNGYIVDSLCYGLFCFKNIRHTGQAFLLNPLREEVLMLPPATASADLDLYGVWFDSTTETYKVVHVFSRASKSEIDMPILETEFDMPILATEVYTLCTSSWLEIPAVPLVLAPCSLRGMTVYAYGDLHWEVRSLPPYGSHKNMIISFDTRKEEFKLTPHPNLLQERRNSFRLFCFKGHLAIVDNNSSLTHLQVWVLKDYDRKEWAIEYRIRADELLLGYQTSMLARIACIGAWEHCILLKTQHNDLVYYNPRTDSVKLMSIPRQWPLPPLDLIRPSIPELW